MLLLVIKELTFRIFFCLFGIRWLIPKPLTIWNELKLACQSYTSFFCELLYTEQKWRKLWVSVWFKFLVVWILFLGNILMKNANQINYNQTHLQINRFSCGLKYSMNRNNFDVFGSVKFPFEMNLNRFHTGVSYIVLWITTSALELNHQSNKKNIRFDEWICEMLRIDERYFKM